MNGKSLSFLPLGFPRGEAGFFDKRHFGTDWQKSLMRGGDRLVNECSYMNGICFDFHHLTGKSETFKLSPPLISQPCRFRSAVKPGSFPPGEAKGAVAGAGSIQRSPQFHLPAGRLLGDPYNGGTKPWVHTLQPTNPSEVEPRTLRASEESPLWVF